MHTLIRTAGAAVALLSAGSVFAAGIDWTKVDAALGSKGSMQPGNVHKYGFPRTDLDVKLDGVSLEPAFALGSWLAFEPVGDHAMVMGDLVLLENEVTPVMKRLSEGGIEITAVHNHLLRARPLPVYMHIEGNGDPVALARTLRSALEASKTPLASASAAAPPKSTLDTQAIDRIMGYKGSAKGDVYAFGIPRAETIKMGNAVVPPSMGTAIGINFEPAGDGKAAVTGDFVLRPEEVNAVLRALEANGIEVMALHSHMLEEQPRVFFMHFWGHDDAGKLARGMRAALDKIDVKQK
ncbi:MAG TPA: DUF1259 domain-containing protein [Gammaproteobacteria bacterium]|nr:DUF1259 domain-containing protein [Gammaproteobacteria bacterium]